MRALCDGALSNHAQLGIDLQPRDDPATSGIELGPPAVIVIAEVEDIGCAGRDRHGLGGSDVIDVGRRDGGIDRAIGTRVIDDVHFGAADAGRELRPVLAQRAQSKASGVDEMHGFASLAPQTTRNSAGQMRKQAAEYLPRPLRIGVRQRGAGHLLAAEVVELRRMARECRFDLAQTLRPGNLRVNQRNQLPLCRQSSHMLVGMVLIHKLIEAMPRHLLQYAVKHAILVPHGAGSFRVSNVGKTSKHRRIHAMHPVHKN